MSLSGCDCFGIETFLSRVGLCSNSDKTEIFFSLNSMSFICFKSFDCTDNVGEDAVDNSVGSVGGEACTMLPGVDL